MIPTPRDVVPPEALINSSQLLAALQKTLAELAEFTEQLRAGIDEGGEIYAGP